MGTAALIVGIIGAAVGLSTYLELILGGGEER